MPVFTNNADPSRQPKPPAVEKAPKKVPKVPKRTPKTPKITPQPASTKGKETKTVKEIIEEAGADAS